ncbi:MAG: TrkA family potassium uptake protein, partial [Candidatus Dadabacteria bacterium]
KEMAHRVAERVSSRNVMDYLSLASGFGVLELAPPREMVGKTLAELDLTRRFGVQVVAVKELIPEQVHITPPPDRVVKDSDILVVYGPEGAVRRLKEA